MDGCGGGGWLWRREGGGRMAAVEGGRREGSGWVAAVEGRVEGGGKIEGGWLEQVFDS